MTTVVPDLDPRRSARERRRRLNLVDRRANRALRLGALGGGFLLLVALGAIVIRLIFGASLAFDKSGFAFIGHTHWIPALDQYGAWPFIYGSLVTSFMGVLLGGVVGVAIGLFLAFLAPRRVAAVIGPVVEMLAAIPSVVLGLIGIILIAPFVRSDIEPWLHSVLGWTGLFGESEAVGNSLFTAGLVLTIMVIPIIAALTRDTFLTVPRDLRDGAEALGSTRWEMIRGIVLPTTKTGVTAACVLGFARAIEEAIAVTQVVGNAPVVHGDLFQTGDTLGSLIANQWLTPQDKLNTSAMLYLALLLLAIGFLTNLLARRISQGVWRRAVWLPHG